MEFSRQEYWSALPFPPPGDLPTQGLKLGLLHCGLRTIPVMEGFARDMEGGCPDALFLNYTNPMAILTGYMQRYTGVNTIGLCHSVQVCSETLLKGLGMEDKLEGRIETIAGINHMGWLLDIRDKDGNDLYPEIRRRAAEKNANEKHEDMVRYEYIKHLLFSLLSTSILDRHKPLLSVHSCYCSRSFRLTTAMS